MKTKIMIASAIEVETPLLAIGLYESEAELTGGVAEVNDALGGIIAQMRNDGELTGKLNEVVLLRPVAGLKTERVAVVGLGKEREFTVDRARQAAGSVAKSVIRSKLTRFAVVPFGKGQPGVSVESIAQAMVEGTVLGTYRYDVYKTDKEDLPPSIAELTIVGSETNDAPGLELGAMKGEVSSAATITARDLANGPANLVTPAYLVERARDIASSLGLGMDVLDKEQMQHLSMGALLGVAKGSAQPPYLIVLRYQGAGEGHPTLALVGKGITFDSGGVSIKPAEGMQDMKYDMSGGAAVLGAIQGLATLKVPVNVLGIVPATENLPSGTANKPGDVLTAMNGKTIEIISTDAEGRLILADALSYAVKLGADAVIDLATLTGACVVALGHWAAAALGKDEALLSLVEVAAEATGERVWRLPLWPQYEQQIKSDIADIKNTGGREGGTITGAAFLLNFVDGKPWVHLDIAGTAYWNRELPYNPKGATGFGVRLLIDFAQRWAAQTS